MSGIVLVILLIFFSSENLSPSELKKLKRKQRKAEKIAELAREKQRAEMEKRELQTKKTQDGDLDGPKEEELVPDKLAKVTMDTRQYVLSGR